MKGSRRIKRMARAQKKPPGLMLTSLMDVFTILVLYLLVNQSSVQIAEPPKEVKLPESVAESKPKETVVVMVSEDFVSIDGEKLVDIRAFDPKAPETNNMFKEVRERLAEIKEHAVGLQTEAEEGDKSNEVTIMAHQKVTFKVLKHLMTVCTAAGYTKISLAVNQKASQS